MRNARPRKRVWGVWDCKYCGNKAIPATEIQCTGCGHPRDTDTEFYTVENSTEVAKEQYSDEVNWICEYCNSQNKGTDTLCCSCGAPRSSTNEDYLDKKIERDIAKKRAEMQAQLEAHRQAQAESAEKPKGFFDKFIKEFKKKPMKFIVPVLAIVLVVGIFSWATADVSHSVMIDDMSWSRSIEIETRTESNESGWTLPTGARLLYEQEEFKEWDKVVDCYETKTREVAEKVQVGTEEYVAGHTDMGNGQFEEIIKTRPVYETQYRTETYEEPVYKEVEVYATKYYYVIDRWKVTETLRTDGKDDEPYWCEYDLEKDEREGDKREKYVIECDKFRVEVPYSIWSKYDIGDKVEIEASRVGNVVTSIDGYEIK